MDDSRTDAIDDERESIRRYYEGLTPTERRTRILLVPAYRDAYNELIQAHRMVEQPAYFWERWVPVLGPVAAVLYMKLRQYCFYSAGEERETCWPKQETLASAIGIRSLESLRGALELLEREGFIQREAACRFDGRTGRPIRTSDRYQVYFEIPLRAEDAAELLIRSVHQIPMTLDSENAGIPLFGSQSQLAEKPLFRESGGDEKAGIPPFRDASETRSHGQKAGIPPFRDASETRSHGQKAGIPPFRGEVDEKAGIPRAEVNVQRIQRSTLCTTDSRFIENSPAETLAAEIAEELDDPGSLKFFRLVADKLPEGRIRIVLSETRQAREQGRLRGAPGRYFTGAIRRVAAELGIAL